ncbi:MAG TPA: SIS domain-containing protein [Candidatus Omnitrophota bacterium]|nr:SIS domain-containing protein [Candidatus Omnitrophota bacterium]
MDSRDKISQIFLESIDVKKKFIADPSAISNVAASVTAIKDCYARGGKVIVFGNGGSASDSQHMAGELVVRFRKERKALACISLSADTAILTAASNDYDFSKVFVRQMEALLKREDLVIAISTSGNSPNVIEAVRYAKDRKVPVIALTGKSGGELAGLADIPIVVKSPVTARVQETHSAIMHAICELVEEDL